MFHRKIPDTIYREPLRNRRRNTGTITAVNDLEAPDKEARDIREKSFCKQLGSAADQILSLLPGRVPEQVFPS